MIAPMKPGSQLTCVGAVLGALRDPGGAVMPSGEMSVSRPVGADEGADPAVDRLCR